MTDRKAVCIIPARGGSKGLPGKNWRNFAGKPLIVHSIEDALECGNLPVFVSTDNDNIARVSEEAGAKVIMRPDEISGDEATSESAIAHVLQNIPDSLEPDTVVFLQATSPHRPKRAVCDALQKYWEGGYDSLLSLSPTHRFFWKIRKNIVEPQYDFMQRPRRQDMSENEIEYVENGSLYIFSTLHFLIHQNRLGGKIGSVIYPEEYAQEIDSELDFNYVEQVFLSATKGE